ncbi:MAG: universal stress protein [Desulfuromonadaceae bacterium]|nr:universal stress protein [Desulfuromonadaceae bacterium]
MKIILAYDDSGPSQRALHTLGWLSAAQPEVVIVMVLNGTALDAEGEPVEADPEDVQQAEVTLTRVRKVVESSGFSVRTEILVGDPKLQILQKALKEHADLIITGCRGHGIAKRLVFGSVSNVILHDAECPVMVVK